MNFSPDVLALNPELASQTTAVRNKRTAQPKEAKPTRPLLNIGKTAVKDRMHEYHCPECGCRPVVGGEQWTPEHGRVGHVRFQCGHIVRGSLK